MGAYLDAHRHIGLDFPRFDGHSDSPSKSGLGVSNANQTTKTYACRTFTANAARLQLHALAYNLGNFLRTLVTPDAIKGWTLTSLREKLIKIGAKVVSHGRYVMFQMAEVAIPRDIFAEVLRRIADLRSPTAPTPT